MVVHHDTKAASSPEVLIVGAGLGGLMLAILLERIQVPYRIFEREKELRSMGSAMTVGASILPVFEQLGLLEEIHRISLPVNSAQFYNAKVEKIGQIKGEIQKITGYGNLLFARPRLYQILVKQVPIHRFILGKKVVRVETLDSNDTGKKVCIHCEDGSSYGGDIVVGADGAYSKVRKCLFSQLEQQGELPAVDQHTLAIGYSSLVGVTTQRDLGSLPHPQLQDPFSHFDQVLGDDTRSWGVASMADNEVAWLLSYQVSPSEAKDAQSRNFNKDWSGPEASDTMLKKFEDLPSPWGGTMGEIFEKTPKESITKVFLEEKLFKTWFHGRTVLIGDACHKMLPSAGQGAVNAMQDAVVLANCIFRMKESKDKDITAAFEEYYRQRYHRAKYQFDRSHEMSKFMSGQSWSERLIRHVMFKYVPGWVHEREFGQSMRYRPQILWLPLVENRGTYPVDPQDELRDRWTVEYSTR